MPPFFVCDEHRLAYEKPGQMTGHYLRGHKKKPDDQDKAAWPRDAVPEGYELRASKPSDTRRRTARAEEPEDDETPEDLPPPPEYPAKPVARTDSPPEPEKSEEDDDVVQLRKIMRGSSLPEQEITQALKGFAIYPQLREDPMSLHRWLQSKIKNKRAHEEIQLMVNAFFAQKQEDTSIAGTIPAYYRPPPRGQQQGGYPGYGAPGPFNPYGQPQGYQPFGPPGYYPPPTFGRHAKDDEDEEKGADPAVAELQLAVANIGQQLADERAAREQEKREAAEAAKDAAHAAELKELRDMIAALATDKNKSETGTVMDRMLEELQKGREESAAYRKLLEDQRLEELKKDNAELRKSMVEVRHEMSTKSATGKTIEDLAGDLGPALIDKVSDGVDKISREVSEMRKELPNILQQGGAGQAHTNTNGATQPAPKKPDGKTRSIEDIAKQGDEENALLDSIEAARKAEASPQADAAAAPAKDGVSPSAVQPKPGEVVITRLTPEEEAKLNASLPPKV